ncbi:MAG: cardiolipin synthase ClsB [Betaproteobacteria bacterium]|nr:cardiolipin synthase ClsB [Betaproteobacteria bacterium]
MAMWTEANQVDLLESGTAYFPALQAAVDSAQHVIYLQTYIFANDGTGRTVTEWLMAAARRGVAVRVLVDGFGSRELNPAWVDEMEDAGVEWLVFRPERLRFLLHRHRLRRMHRKVVVVDDRLVLIGGINIIDDMDTDKQIPPRYDYAVRVQGKVVKRIAIDVRRLWAFIAWAHGHISHSGHALATAKQTLVGHDKVAYVIRDNLRHRRDIEEAYLSAIASAKRQVLIANAYFLPGPRFRHALTDAAQRGVQVVLLLQWRAEYRLLHYATQAWYGELLTAGVEICEYHRGFLHAKVAVIDGHWATVGSSNIDPFSLLLAREANVLVDSPRFAEELFNALQAAIQRGGQWVKADGWRKRPWHQRAFASIAMLLVRVLMGLVGYAQKW